MNSLINENIIKLIINSLDYIHANKTLKATKNKIICIAILKTLNYKDIFKSLGKTKKVIKTHNDYIRALTNLNKDYIISSSSDKTLKVWNINTYSCIETLSEHKTAIQDVITLDNGIIASCTWDQIKIWNTNDDFKCINTISFEGYNSFVKLLKLNNGDIVCPAYFGDITYLLILDHREDYSCIKATIQGHSNWIVSVENLSDDKFASGSEDCTINIWDSNDIYKCVKTLDEHVGSVYALLFDGKDLLISGSFDKTIKMWNVSNDYECIYTIKAGNQICCLLLLPGGYFASGSWDEEIKIWDMGFYNCIKILKGHDDGITSLVLLSENRIASSSFDNTIIIWS
jgi:WD40 repeat protein